ncbi:branched-chain amino acid ABC transporter permease [Bradyrhizobium uaiense]|uniref:Branched-chain amino acid ABC transporter permease n=1 Tax=Bradyrhizobium uaiense TaxID=2594946 RepID=A0A6P1BB33_9BRAD|nr:branched-chain amino acid ABC transporter permease [Bradyrhizobium uaiense]NEU95627.1 branched-chain amino acid ABC transporter permease [Bradyrhizobium uaiense]
MKHRGRLVALAAGTCVLSIYPAFADEYHLTVLRDALLFGLFAVSLDFFWGSTGILSFGHATFFGLGGYVMTLVTMTSGLPAPSVLGLFAAVGAPAALAAIVGYFLLFGGVRGSFFTIVTLALSVIAQQLVISWSSVTGGDTGLLGVPPLALGGYEISGAMATYIVVAVTLIVVLLALRALEQSRWGKILIAIGDNEVRAAALGHNAPARLTLTFVISAAVAGFAGGLYVAIAGVVAPDLIGLLLSTEVIVWVAIGGRGTLLGPVVGAVLVQRAQQEISSMNPSLWPLILGCTFVIIVFVAPDGVMSIAERSRMLLRRRSA